MKNPTRLLAAHPFIAWTICSIVTTIFLSAHPIDYDVNFFLWLFTRLLTFPALVVAEVVDLPAPNPTVDILISAILALPLAITLDWIWRAMVRRFRGRHADQDS